MIFTAHFNKKCRGDEKCQKLCNGNGQPDAGDTEENRKDKYHGKLEHQGSQEGDHGRDQSVVQRREEGRTKYIEAVDQEGYTEQTETVACHLKKLRIVSNEDLCDR